MFRLVGPAGAAAPTVWTPMLTQSEYHALACSIGPARGSAMTCPIVDCARLCVLARVRVWVRASSLLRPMAQDRSFQPRGWPCLQGLG
eukprot:2207012-Alexandrium_andersonii.AAC.1